MRIQSLEWEMMPALLTDGPIGGGGGGGGGGWSSGLGGVRGSEWWGWG